MKRFPKKWKILNFWSIGASFAKNISKHIFGNITRLGCTLLNIKKNQFIKVDWSLKITLENKAKDTNVFNETNKLFIFFNDLIGPALESLSFLIN